MKTPTQEQFQKIIDTLEKAPSGAKVDMQETQTNKCGYPMCFAGWYLILSGINKKSFTSGVDMVAKDLGFTHAGDLKLWAKQHKDIWGNESGYFMFSSEHSFGGHPLTITLETIIDHWKGVKERAAVL